MIDRDSEIDGLLTALDGRFVRPAPGGDLLRTPAILPTGRNLARLRPVPHPQPAFAMRDGAKQAERLLARHVESGNPLPERHRHRALGHRQPEERGRPDRPGAGADGRQAALRRLWPALRRRTDPAGRARPPAHRRGDDAVGHLPRSAAAADPAPGRGRAARRPRPTSRSSRTICAATRWPTRRSMAATSRPRPCASSPMPTAPMAPTSTISSRTAAGTTRTSWPRPIQRRKSLRLWRHRQAGAAEGTARHDLRRASISPTRTSNRSSSASPRSTSISTRSAASAAR